MGPFRFRLSRVLDWRDNQRQLEQNRLAGWYAERSRKDQELKDLLAAQIKAERALLASSSITAGELHALEDYRRGAKAQEQRLRAELLKCEREIGQQIERVKIAQRNVRLLEKLNERRAAEHTEAVTRELEEVAADAYLAKFAREL